NFVEQLMEVQSYTVSSSSSSNNITISDVKAVCEQLLLSKEPKVEKNSVAAVNDKCESAKGEPVVCQWCSKAGHDAKRCFKLQKQLDACSKCTHMSAPNRSGNGNNGNNSRSYYNSNNRTYDNTRHNKFRSHASGNGN